MPSRAEPGGRRATAAPLGMGLFVLVEAMMFAGFISAYLVVRSSVPQGAWPPSDQPRLPFGRTAVNTAALLAGGVALWMAGRRFRAGRRTAAGVALGLAGLLTAAFVLAQGVEWVRLLAQGLTLTSSQLGSFFYLIVGAHALHALAAVVALAAAWLELRADRLTPGRLGATQVFCFFVVLLWPLLYWMVYR